jgi:hypothetical protein
MDLNSNLAFEPRLLNSFQRRSNGIGIISTETLSGLAFFIKLNLKKDIKSVYNFNRKIIIDILNLDYQYIN